MEEEHKHNHKEKMEEKREEVVKTQETENTEIKKISVPETSKKIQEVPVVETPTEAEKKDTEIKTEEKKEKKKQVIIKKDKAIVRGINLHISTKHSMAIGRFIKGKKTQEAIKDLEKVVKLKKVVPMKGEIPHRHGKGIMSGRYPVNAAKVFIKLLKTLEGNARVNGLGENSKIIFTNPSIASRPYGRFGAHRKKRTNVIIEVKAK